MDTERTIGDTGRGAWAATELMTKGAGTTRKCRRKRNRHRITDSVFYGFNGGMVSIGAIESIGGTVEGVVSTGGGDVGAVVGGVDGTSTVDVVVSSTPAGAVVTAGAESPERIFMKA